MKAIITLKVEIIDGPDKGYVLEEKNRLVELQRDHWEGLFNPYIVKVAFMTPELYREHMEHIGRD